MTSDSVCTGERAALRKAIAEQDTTKDAVRVAHDSTNRSAEQVRSAEKKLAAFGDVDSAILEHRAASFKSAAQGGPKPTLALPDDLVRRERARDEAASAVAAAKAAHASLAGELAAAEKALHRAEFKVSEAANHVLVAGAIEPGGALTRIWSDLWATIDMLNGLRASLHVKLPPDIVRTLESFGAMDHRMFAGGRNDQLTRAGQHWRSYHTALCKCADATQPDLTNERVSSAVINRVA
jgi:hypothetical protein